MSGSDVFGGEMNNDVLSDDMLERLLIGECNGISPAHPVAEFLLSARAVVSGIEPGEPNAALREFLETGVSAPTEVIDLSRARRRRRGAMVAFAGTALGKVAIGVAVAAAVTTGAHVSRVVDVPLLPEVRGGSTDFAEGQQPVVVSAPQPATVSSTTPDTPTSSVPLTAIPEVVVTTSEQPDVLVDETVDLDVSTLGSFSLSVDNESFDFLSAELTESWTLEESERTADGILLTFVDRDDRVTVEIQREGELFRVHVRDSRSGDESIDHFALDGRRVADSSVDEPKRHEDKQPVTDGPRDRPENRIDERTGEKDRDREGERTEDRGKDSELGGVESTTTLVSTTTTTAVDHGADGSTKPEDKEPPRNVDGDKVQNPEGALLKDSD